MLRKSCLLLTALCCAWLNQDCSAQQASTLDLVSNDANLIAFVNVERIYGTKMAAREKWIEGAEVRLGDSPLWFPDSIKHALIASKIDLAQGSRLWEESYLTVKYGIDMETVAKNTKGFVDQLGDYKCVHTGPGGLLLKLTDKTLATKFPPNRQDVARWAQEVANGETGKLSPYFTDVVDRARANDDFEIGMMIDLQYAVSPNQIRSKLQDVSEDAEPLKSRIDDLVSVLSSIRGATLAIALKDKAEGTLTIDFAESAEPIAADAKTLVISALMDKGLYINELDKWQFVTEGKQIKMSGELSSDGLALLFSLIEPPRAPISKGEMEYTEASEADKMETMGLATQKHYQSVQRYLTLIRRYQPPTRNALASYFELYARKIESLPIMGVDEMELDYASQVADILRQVATGRRDTVARRAATEKQYQGYNYSYSYGRYGWYGGGRSSDTAARAASAGIVAAEVTSKSELMNEIDKFTAAVRRELTKKYEEYQIEF